RNRRAQHGPPARQALDLERAAEHGEAILEPAQPGPALEPRPAGAVVGYLERDDALPGREAHTRVRRARVLDHIRERLGRAVVEGGLDAGLEPAREATLDPHGQRRPLGERTQ